jgi:hypothetical protein
MLQLARTMPALLSIAFARWYQRDDCSPVDRRPAGICSSACAGNLPHRRRISRSASSFLDFSVFRSPPNLGFCTLARGDWRAKSRSFLPAAPTHLFLISADGKSMAPLLDGHAFVCFLTVLRAMVPEGKGVLCLKFSIPIARPKMGAARCDPCWPSCCWCSCSYLDTGIFTILSLQLLSPPAKFDFQQTSPAQANRQGLSLSSRRHENRKLLIDLLKRRLSLAGLLSLPSRSISHSSFFTITA